MHRPRPAGARRCADRRGGRPLRAGAGLCGRPARGAGLGRRPALPGVVLRVLARPGRQRAGRRRQRQIVDSPELGDDAIEVHVIGIEPDRYVQWFNTQATGFQDTQPVPPRLI